jgi:hypothetical protein
VWSLLKEKVLASQKVASKVHEGVTMLTRRALCGVFNLQGGYARSRLVVLSTC